MYNVHTKQLIFSRSCLKTFLTRYVSSGHKSEHWRKQVLNFVFVFVTHLALHGPLLSVGNMLLSEWQHHYNDGYCIIFQAIIATRPSQVPIAYSNSNGKLHNIEKQYWFVTQIIHLNMFNFLWSLKFQASTYACPLAHILNLNVSLFVLELHWQYCNI